MSMKKKQYQAQIAPVADTITRIVPLAKEDMIAHRDTYLTQNAVAVQYNNTTPTYIAWLVNNGILFPRYIITADNNPRQIVAKLFASSDVDFVATMRTISNGWDYAGLLQYWRGQVIEVDVPTYFVQGGSTYTENEKQRVALDTNYYRQVKLDEDK